jgi:uracil-DNA glycosylase
MRRLCDQRRRTRTPSKRIVVCTQCTTATDRHLLRDAEEHVPQPGYIGSNYDARRVLLVGQNPAIPGVLAAADLPYTAALRSLRDEPSVARYRELSSVLESFVPRWPVHGSYFPLQECGLTLQDIAYCNIVRCRTAGKPGRRLSEACIAEHFTRWLALLRPKVVVFVGKWAADVGGPATAAAGVPFGYMNRMRSLSSPERVANRQAVVELVTSCQGLASALGT